MRDFTPLDSRMPLMIVYTAIGLPLTVSIMMRFSRTPPGAIEDAARTDDAGPTAGALE
jgi:ABC-type glycerol-3-phosphate transport system permease component